MNRTTLQMLTTFILLLALGCNANRKTTVATPAPIPEVAAEDGLTVKLIYSDNQAVPPDSARQFNLTVEPAVDEIKKLPDGRIRLSGLAANIRYTLNVLKLNRSYGSTTVRREDREVEILLITNISGDVMTNKPQADSTSDKRGGNLGPIK